MPFLTSVCALPLWLMLFLLANVDLRAGFQTSLNTELSVQKNSEDLEVLTVGALEEFQPCT